VKKKKTGIKSDEAKSEQVPNSYMTNLQTLTWATIKAS
jgi:hypothetical protein